MSQPPSPKQLCKRCDRLELGRMLADEVNERPMGAISHYRNPTCPFCGLIARAKEVASADGWDLTTFSLTNPSPRLFIQSRSGVSVKNNGYVDHRSPRLLLAVDQKPSRQQNRRPLREIDRLESRYILAEIESLSNDDLQGLMRRRDIPCRLSVPLVQHWLKGCKEHKHSAAALKRGSTGPFDGQPFRLIDVMQECLTLQLKRCDYVALSYVWGTSPTILTSDRNPESLILVTTRQNLSVLCHPHALSSSHLRLGRIPQTISDAMELTRKIGIQYLWVDTLCIVQDDEQDKARLISHIDDVYDNSTVTIMAATGNGPDEGLAGIGPRVGCPIKPHYILDERNGGTLSLSLSLPSLCHEVRKGVWDTRGWTFQEQSLSQRCLYFTSDEIFFQCPEVQWREGYDYGEGHSPNTQVQIRTGPPWWSKRLRNDPDPTPYHYLGDTTNGLDVECYQRAVQEYSRRHLTYSHDILNAFEGIFNRFQQAQQSSRDLSIRQTQGIPAHLMVQALLWFPSESCRQRVSTERFSTWSWASWVGPVEFIFAESLWLSRSISHAPRKNAPLHIAIAQWHFGDANSGTWSNRAWQPARELRGQRSRHSPTQDLTTQRYLSDVIGIRPKPLLDQSLNPPQPSLRCGQLGFIGAFLGSGSFDLSDAVTERIKSLVVSKVHIGQFRFDGDMAVPVTELVMVVCTITVMSLPRTIMIFLGMTTRDGVSVRVGIGYAYYSKDAGAHKPPWEYKFFVME
ncbi:HET-domain-containing protein [Aspergillus heteromorphus CBS 117.55]|uniref:HET-domain-containing protein n=1 Tax=Aspergillus heteromorphus CBS 117.55 TaxID=1448321 RepID=A0A317WX79_9EURO|nr:HET-domain-containing protein [Aspergillus heteromorphus CBS 117.55]PWY90953.1 HET-domain-containing protein [Aspergillus heteromorphus CBS 117.55]